MYVPHERRALILRLLEQRGYLRTAELAAELRVTEETIRTDIIALHARKLLQRVHGGARYIPPTGGAEDGTRLDCQLISLLLPHIGQGMRVYMDSGALAHALLPHMAERGCCVITPSLRLAMAAAAPALGLQVRLPGGLLDGHSQMITATQAEREAFLQDCQAELALLFPPALPSPKSVAYHHGARADWAATAAATAARVIILAPAHAFYTQAEYTVGCKTDLLITEDNLPPAFDGQVAVELIPYLSAADLVQEE